jgi:S1-C subfamily serine protease
MNAYGPLCGVFTEQVAVTALHNHQWHLFPALHSMLLAGFIVDKSRGIICTNRHVVTPGGQQGTQEAAAAT